jgi:adenosyl cobinamide kinase/adenosyl cobinamide phosphate guanylyltransferase
MKNHAQKLIEATEKHTLRPQKEDRARVLIEVLQYLIDNMIHEDAWYVEEEDLYKTIQELKAIEQNKKQMMLVEALEYYIEDGLKRSNCNQAAIDAFTELLKEIAID